MASDQQQQQHEEPNPISNPMVNTFMEITSSTPEEAQFFLESHNFDLDAAVSTFFESTTAYAPPIPTAELPDTAADVERSLSPSPSPSRSRSHSPPAAVARSQYNLRARANRSGVRTLADLNNDGSGSDGDDDGDRPPQYFTGGHKSGMVVEDPSKDNNVEAIFDHARRVGAMEGPAEVYQPSSSSRSFAGTARLLSGETVSSSPHEPPPEVVTHTITFWRNGFTVNDGPLRLLDDEDNASFLESIKNSECPKELEPKDRRTKVSVNLTRRDENCPVREPERQPIAFQGVGRTLGSTTPAPSESTVLHTAPAPVMGLVVDDKLPSTSIQLRLADGTRMVSRFNHHHTIRDIRGFIDASRPTSGVAYTLQLMGFPPKPLTELDQTIEQAGLSNSVVIQKY